VQLLRVFFPGRENGPAQVDFGRLADATEQNRTESNRLDRIEWDWNQGWQ
jgi:hypothetical protein